MARNLRIRIDHNKATPCARHLRRTFSGSMTIGNRRRSILLVTARRRSSKRQRIVPVSAITVEDAETGEQLFP
jgi:hypothetical protein